MENSHNLTPDAFIAIQIGVWALTDPNRYPERRRSALESRRSRRRVLENRLASNASLRVSNVACVLLARVVQMMHGTRNLPPIGGMREMFEGKWLE
jgi:hypothetical protein